MEPGALVYPARRITCRSERYHPYYNHDSFNNLRHRLPSAISAGDYSDYYFDKPWSCSPPVCVDTYMPHPPYLSNHGQDAIYPFPQATPHFVTPPFDSEPGFNVEDPEFGSLSGDDDAGGFDSNAQLRSQQLNSDGTPKRPMNAFMIFARKRRPMVSSEQPTMRTGEISKILSKEWSEMRKEDKQFYLDQAKKLKDTFNTRWPDYVYRRRPNNSRKRRKLGAAGAGAAHDHDATPNSDGQLEAFIDPNASSQSGDESKSQSTASPLNVQNQLLYTPSELGQTRALDRSPTPAGVLAGYTRSSASPYAPPIRPNYLEEPVPNAYVPQVHVYGDSDSMYYGCLPSNAGVHDHSPELNIGTKDWHSFGIASGVVGPMSTSTPPSSSPLMHVAPRIHHLQATQAPNKWLKTSPTNEVHPYEAQSALWGTSPLTAGPDGADSQEINATLPSPASGSHARFTRTGSPNSNALGMRLYDGREKSAFDDGHYRPAYMEPGRFNHLAPESHSTLTPPPFQGSLPAPQNGSPSAYFEPNCWAPGEHSG